MAPQKYLNLNYAAWKAANGLVNAPRGNLGYEVLSRCLSLLDRGLGPGSSLEPAEVPLIIVGHWRSGTSMVHDLICADQNVCYPTTTACMNPQRFLLSRPSTFVPTQQSIARPMDQMILKGDSPQEDEFALFMLGAPSPYAALIYPELIRSLDTLSRLDLVSADEQRRWFDIHSRFLKHVQANAGGKPLVLKSPTHSFRISELAERYPNARFIYVTRNPYMVFASTRFLWQEMWKLYSLTPPPDTRSVDEAITQTMISLDSIARRSLTCVPQSRWMTIRYEEFLQNPSDRLVDAGEQLNLPFLKMHNRDRENVIANLSTYRRNKHVLSKRDVELIRDACAPLFSTHQYDVNEVEV